MCFRRMVVWCLRMAPGKLSVKISEWVHFGILARFEYRINRIDFMMGSPVGGFGVGMCVDWGFPMRGSAGLVGT